MKEFKYLDDYVKLYKDGSERSSRYLPKLIIYFRQAFEKLGIDDNIVPNFFGWDKETGEDFWSWGHNSRWNHTFDSMLSGDTDDYVELLKQKMIEKGIKDFEVKLPDTPLPKPKTVRQETIEYLKTLGINADERFTDWEQHNNPELEDESGTGGLWDLSRTIMNELSEDEMQTLIYGLLCMLGDIK